MGRKRRFVKQAFRGAWCFEPGWYNSGCRIRNCRIRKLQEYNCRMTTIVRRPFRMFHWNFSLNSSLDWSFGFNSRSSLFRNQVLEVGSGPFCLLSRMAVQSGARQVLGLELSSDLWAHSVDLLRRELRGEARFLVRNGWFQPLTSHYFTLRKGVHHFEKPPGRQGEDGQGVLFRGCSKWRRGSGCTRKATRKEGSLILRKEYVLRSKPIRKILMTHGGFRVGWGNDFHFEQPRFKGIDPFGYSIKWQSGRTMAT